MKSAQTSIATIACNLFDLMAFTANPETEETIISQSEPFGLRITVEFSRSGAIALMPLALSIRVDFFAKPYGIGDAIDLGSVTITTVKGQFTYCPTLHISEGPQQVGLIPEQLYNVSTLLRVGATDAPALITGVIEDLTIQTYSP